MQPEHVSFRTTRHQDLVQQVHAQLDPCRPEDPILLTGRSEQAILFCEGQHLHFRTGNKCCERALLRPRGRNSPHERSSAARFLSALQPTANGCICSVRAQHEPSCQQRVHSRIATLHLRYIDLALHAVCSNIGITTAAAVHCNVWHSPAHFRFRCNAVMIVTSCSSTCTSRSCRDQTAPQRTHVGRCCRFYPQSGVRLQPRHGCWPLSGERHLGAGWV